MMQAKMRAVQRGATLIVALVMLVILTLFALTMIKMSSGNLLVVGNMQVQKETEAAAQQMVERHLDTINAFESAVTLAQPSPPTTACGTTSGGTTVNWTLVGGKYVCQLTNNGYTTKVYLPECTYSEPSPGYAIDEVPGYSPPEDTYWDVAAEAQDSLTGAKVEIHQGVRIQRTKGNCP